MNEPQLPPSADAASARASATPLIIAATVVLLASVAGSAYVLNQRLETLASAEPQGLREIRKAVADLSDQLDMQADTQARRIEALQKDIRTLQTQQEQQTQQPMPDLEAMQETLDRIAQKVEQQSTATVPAAPAKDPATAEETPASPPTVMDAQAQVPTTDDSSAALRNLLALRRAVESGTAFETELEALKPQMELLSAEDRDTLYTYADTGLANLPTPSVTEAEAAPDGWMQRVNRRLNGLVTIRRSGTGVNAAQPVDVTRDDVIAALERLEASMLKATE